MPYLTWLSQTNRNGGEHNTPNVTVPANIDTILIRLLVNPAVFETPSKSLTIAIEVSTDDAQTWQTQFVVGWVGGPEPVHTGGRRGWYAAVSGIRQFAGALARAHASQSGNFRWGLEGEIR